ncbi:hypothetical protein ACFQ07_05635 [Actinomadura adrarensis]|uniref:Uncharacterized protein n=1 Tax=Actinomadura adrarensis TaxID=1819600 RepID=A0ABW3CDF9_9ACTN
MLDTLPRLPDALELVERGKYFVVHALAQELNATCRYAAVRVSCERAGGVEDLRMAQEAIRHLAGRAEHHARPRLTSQHAPTRRPLP